VQKTKPVKDPRKQRKRLHNAPAHFRHKYMAAPLASDLYSKGAKSLPVRKGDTVRVVRGDHAGFEGKVSRVDLKRYRIFLEGLTREKVDGTNIFVSVHPSKVMIKNLKLDDKWRQAILEHKKQLAQPTKEKKAKKPKAAKPKKEKPAKETPEVQKKPAEKAPTAAKKTVPKKPAAKKKEEKPAKKETKPKTAKTATATAKKPRAKRKAASKTKGGT
jgi:large subunit ribosomal protein L24